MTWNEIHKTTELSEIKGELSNEQASALYIAQEIHEDKKRFLLFMAALNMNLGLGEIIDLANSFDRQSEVAEYIDNCMDDKLKNDLAIQLARMEE